MVAMPLLAYAQKEPGTFILYPRIGANWSTFHGDLLYYGLSEQDHVDSKYRCGFTAGAEVQYQIGDYWAVSGGALYSRQGTDFKAIPQGDGDVLCIKTDNLLVPILLVGTTSFGLSAKIGLQPEFCIHSTAFKDAVEKVNLSLPVGLSYEWHQVSLDIRYAFGLTKVYKEGINEHAKGRTVMLTLGYAFDL